jgi:hypothetical protein
MSFDRQNADALIATAAPLFAAVGAAKELVRGPRGREGRH